MAYSTPSRKRRKAGGGTPGYNRKRAAKRRRGGDALVMHLPRSVAPIVSDISILKRQQTVELVYAEPIATQLSGTGCTYTLNSIHDPNAALGGEQPRGFDELALLYNKYRVLSAAFVVHFRPSITTAQSTKGFRTYCTVHLSGNQPADERAYAEAKSTVQAHKGGFLSSTTPQPNGNLITTCKGGVDIKRFTGGADNDNLESFMNGSPATRVQLSVQSFGTNAAGAAATQVGEYHVTLRFRVMLFDPKSPTAS